MLRIIFAGTPSFTLPVLEVLAKEFSLVGILTSPARRQGRRMELRSSQVYAYAESLKKEGILACDLPIFTPEKLDNEFISSIATLEPDLLVCFAYGKIFPTQMIDVFRFGGINIHPSLLPKWRGPSPIPFAIYSGDVETGVSIQTIKEKMDTGDILIQEKFKIQARDTTDILLSSKVPDISVMLLKKVLFNLELSIKNAKVQREEDATYSRLIRKEDGLIDWNRSALEIERQILAFMSWPGTYTFCDGKKLNIVDAVAIDDITELEDFIVVERDAKCGSVIGKKNDMGIFVMTGKGVLCVRELQWQTKKALKWKDFLNGSPGVMQAVFS